MSNSKAKMLTGPSSGRIRAAHGAANTQPRFAHTTKPKWITIINVVIISTFTVISTIVECTSVCRLELTFNSLGCNLVNDVHYKIRQTAVYKYRHATLSTRVTWPMWGHSRVTFQQRVMLVLQKIDNVRKGDYCRRGLLSKHAQCKISCK